VTHPAVISALRLRRGEREIGYRVAGGPDGPAVLLTHGAGLDHRVFAPQVEILRERYRVITWDLPGHGDSRPMPPRLSLGDMVDDLMAVLDDAGVERAVLAGHSMGADVSQEAVFRNPNRVSALIVISSVRLFDARGPIGGLFAALPPWKIRLGSVARFRQAIADGASSDPRVRDYVARCMGRLSRADLAAVWSAIARGPHSEDSYRFPCPLLVMVGAGDRLGGGFIPRAARTWVELEREARLASIPGAGHVPTLERPRAANAALLDFLDRFASKGTFP